MGESGSGKSATSLSIMRLIDPPGFIAGGEILFRGTDLVRLSEKEMRRLRGRDLCMVFQEPMTALNPVYTVGEQVVEAVRAHRDVSKREAMARAVELFKLVGIPAPEQRVHDYPHRLSGGMRQRVTIAMALANEPDLLVLDEPTTALDVTIQAQILELVKDLRDRVNTAVLLITHDIGVVAEMCDEVVVMYGGRVMERGRHGPALDGRRSTPTAGRCWPPSPSRGCAGGACRSSAGSVPNPLAMPPGCPFAPRCPHAWTAARRCPR